MRRAAIGLIVVVASCSRPQPNADTAATGAGASTAGASTAAAPGVAAPSTAAPAPQQSAAGAGDVPSSNAAIPPQQQAPRPGGTRPGPSVPTGDVIVGKVNEHGFDPELFLAITPAGGSQTRLSGTQLRGLGSVKGAEVWARGKREAGTFRVDTFEVRRANNQAVEDGIVSVSGTTVTVRTARGVLRYPDAPTDLRNAAGSRVWITPPVQGQAPSFGVIRPN